MNFKKTIGAIFFVSMAVLSLTGCKEKEGESVTEIDFSIATNENEIDYEFPETETYTNYIQMEEGWGELTKQNNAAAIGDPFVLRYDGKYYMYPSTAGATREERGVRVFESDDLVHWTHKGFAATGVEAEYGWAPEVVYYNGTFYMVVAVNREHYILTSDSPLGPFVPATGSIGCNFDGTLYIDDAGEMYLIYAQNYSLNGTKLNGETLEPTGKKVALNGYMGGDWIEGPHFFRRNNILYLTYCGGEVRSEGYRLGYSYIMDGNPLGFFNHPADNSLILNASGNGYYGLGHSSNVIGPNLDSWYTAYHTILETDFPYNRQMMLDQLVTNGSMLLANGPTFTATTVPERPDYETRELKSGDFSNVETGELYTVEYNITPESSSVLEFVFGYKDEKNYSAVRWDLANESMALTNVIKGKETEVQYVENTGMLANKLHTVRIEKGADTVIVYVDNLKRLEASAKGIGTGKIGVTGAAVCSYIAFDNDVFGTSDFESIKNLPSSFSAVHYLKGENRGFSIANAEDVENGIRQNEPEHTQKDADTQISALILDTPNDWVKYAVKAEEESYYGLSGTVTAASSGARIQVIIDSKDVYTFTVPDTGEVDEAEFPYVNVMLGQFPLTKGNHTLKIRLCSGTFEVQKFEMETTNPTKITYENTLDTINEVGWVYRGNWDAADQAHVVLPSAGDFSYACAGDDGLTDFTLEVEVALLEKGTIYDGGIFFHATEICPPRGKMGYESMRSYYLAIRDDQISLKRLNYDEETIDFMSADFAMNEYHKIKIQMKNNYICVYLDDMDKPVIEYYDPSAFLTGQVVLGSYGTKMGFKNLRITN